MRNNTQTPVEEQPTTLADIDVHDVQEGLSSALRALLGFGGPVFEQVQAADECIDALVSLVRHLDAKVRTSTVDSDADADRARAIGDDTGCPGVPEPKAPVRSVKALLTYVQWVLLGLFRRVAALENATPQPVAESAPVAAPKRRKARKKAKAVQTDSRTATILNAIASADCTEQGARDVKRQLSKKVAGEHVAKPGAVEAIGAMSTRQRKHALAVLDSVPWQGGFRHARQLLA